MHTHHPANTYPQLGLVTSLLSPRGNRQRNGQTDCKCSTSPDRSASCTQRTCNQTSQAGRSVKHLFAPSAFHWPSAFHCLFSNLRHGLALRFCRKKGGEAKAAPPPAERSPMPLAGTLVLAASLRGGGCTCKFTFLNNVSCSCCARLYNGRAPHRHQQCANASTTETDRNK